MIMRLATSLLDMILPPLCSGCKNPVGAVGTLCPTCWQGLTFIATPHCACCGLPFDILSDSSAMDTMLCDACLAQRPAFDRARAPLVYDEASRALILRFKHGDALHLSRLFAPLLAGAGAALLARADALVPVPLSRRRLWKRRYNQSAELARQLSQQTSIPSLLHMLRRVRATPSQGGLTQAERRKNVKGAFAVADPAQIAGKTIVLIDDVMTSGATVNEAAKTLKDAGAARVDVLAIARVPRSGY